MARKILYLLIFVVMLSACAPISTLPTPSNTPKPITPSATSTQTETPIPTQTETPTITPDPGMPAGTLGRDNLGYYVDVAESGQTYRYRKMIAPNTNGEGINGWFRSTTPTKIPVFDRGRESFFSQADMAPLSVFVAANVSGASEIISFTHQNELIKAKGNTNFSETLLGELLIRVVGSRSKYFQLSHEDLESYLKKIESGQIPIPFTSPDGQFDWKPSKKVGAEVYVVNWDDAAPTSENGFVEWKDPKGKVFRSKVFADTRYNLIVVIASQTSLNDLDDEGLRELILHNLIRVVFTPDQSFLGFMSGIDEYIRRAGDPQSYFIQVNRSQ